MAQLTKRVTQLGWTGLWRLRQIVIAAAGGYDRGPFCGED
jgi:hypothetical protein